MSGACSLRSNQPYSKPGSSSRLRDGTCKGPVVGTSMVLEKQKGKASVAGAEQTRRREVRDEIRDVGAGPCRPLWIQS